MNRVAQEGLVDVELYLPAPGEVVRHYKGSLYTVICVGRLSEARDQLHVVYWSHERKTVWIRPLGMFVELVDWPDGTHRPRFERANTLAAAGRATCETCGVQYYGLRHCAAPKQPARDSRGVDIHYDTAGEPEPFYGKAYAQFVNASAADALRPHDRHGQVPAQPAEDVLTSEERNFLDHARAQTQNMTSLGMGLLAIIDRLTATPARDSERVEELEASLQTFCEGNAELRDQLQEVREVTAEMRASGRGRDIYWADKLEAALNHQPAQPDKIAELQQRVDELESRISRATHHYRTVAGDAASFSGLLAILEGRCGPQGGSSP